MAIRIEVGDQGRRFLLDYPADWYLHLPLPLLVVLHDENQTAAEARDTMLLHRNNALPAPVAGELSRCVVLYPEGIARDAKPVWNDGHTRSSTVDDVAFLHGIVDWAKAHFQVAYDTLREGGSTVLDDLPDIAAIDETRVALIGYGNGGAMAYRAAVAPGAPWSSVVVVNGTIGGWAHGQDSGTAALGADWDPALVGVPPAPDLVLFHIRGSDDIDWACERSPPFAGAFFTPEGTMSFDDVGAFLEMEGYTPFDAWSLARWDFNVTHSVNAWLRFLGTGVTVPAPPADLDVPGVPGGRVKLEVHPFDHTWQILYTDHILAFLE